MHFGFYFQMRFNLRWAGKAMAKAILDEEKKSVCPLGKTKQ